MSIDTGSLGTWIEGVPSGISPAIDQPNIKNNNTTLQKTYDETHVPIGSSNYAGQHSVVLFAPMPVPAQKEVWQVFLDSQTSLLSALPPTGMGTQTQLLVSTATIAQSNGTTWTYSVTASANVTCDITVVAPIGGNSIFVYVIANITTGGDITTLFIPFNDSTGTQVEFGIPVCAIGAVGLLKWSVMNTVAPTEAPTLTTNIIYKNGFWASFVAGNANFPALGCAITLVGQ